MRMRVIDHTGDSVTNIADFKAAKGKFKALSKTHLPYDASNNTILHKLTPDVDEVIWHKKLVGG